MLKIYFGLKFDKGKTVWILGNGPSLKKFSPDIVQDDDIVIVCNYFYANNFLSDLKVDFYCSSDPRLFHNLVWLDEVMKLKPRKILVPVRNIFKIPIKHQNSILYYNYVPYFKLWQDNLSWLRNTSLFKPLKTGDTVVFDVMFALALSLKPRKIHIVGVDLQHNGKVIHSYDERLVKGPRRDDHYLNTTWQEKTKVSRKKLMSEIDSNNVVEWN
jgi:hypothetical protein